MKYLLRIILFLPLFHALAAEPQVRLELVPQDGIFRMYPLAYRGGAGQYEVGSAEGLNRAGGQLGVPATSGTR